MGIEIKSLPYGTDTDVTKPYISIPVIEESSLSKVRLTILNYLSLASNIF
jgi:hypothetical protein